MTLADDLRGLPRPSSEGSFTLGPPLSPWCRLARGVRGGCVLLIDVEPTGASTPRRLKQLTFLPPQPVEIRDADGAARIEKAALLVCESEQPDLVALFLRLVGVLLDGSGPRPREEELEQRIDQLSSLLRALDRPGEQTVQGLWGELAIVAWSANPRVALAAWHSGARAMFDFEALPDRLEVKTCRTALREHALRYEQTQELPGGVTVFASLVLEASTDGVSVRDLVDTILERVGHDAELRRRLETIVTRSLGRDWRDGSATRFSEDRARGELRLYDAGQLPRLPGPLPAEITQVRYVLDFSTTSPLRSAALRATAPFFADALPPWLA